MDVLRARNPEVVELMNFITNDYSEEGESCEELKQMMTQSKDDVCVAVVFDKNKLVAHTCGYKHKDRNYIWSFNSWAKHGLEKKYAVMCFNIIKNWSISHFGIYKMKCETIRNPRVMKRAYGWELHSSIMELNFKEYKNG